MSHRADASALQDAGRLLPDEKDIRVSAAADSLVLSGLVSSSVKAAQAMQIAESFIRTYSRGLTLAITAGNQEAQQGERIAVGQSAVSGGGAGQNTAPRVVNLLRIVEAQQVMLEVTVAEVSKTLLDKLGVGIDGARVSGSWRYSILSNLLTGSAAHWAPSRAPARSPWMPKAATVSSRSLPSRTSWRSAATKPVSWRAARSSFRCLAPTRQRVWPRSPSRRRSSASA
jgi:pilus assembly protein CpaC